MDIKHSPSGKVIVSSTGYTAFIPNPLPPSLDWTTDLVNTLSRADHLLGKLSREGLNFHNPYLLIRPFMTREAVLSSQIEGTQATLEEMLIADLGASTEKKPADVREVENYIAALEFGIERLHTFPLSLRLIKEMHEKLMEGVRGNHATPGEFRKTQNWIGPPGCMLTTAKYVPPPSDELPRCLDLFEKFLHDRTLPPLVHMALCHYQFEAIHPFLDGNGRIGRLLITLLLMERKILLSPLLYLSAFFEATREEYYKQLYTVSAQGTWNDWIMYFLNGVALQSADVVSRSERIHHLINHWLTMVGGGSSGLLHQIIQNLAANPFLTTKKLADDLQVAFTTAGRAIQKLESLGVLQKTADKKRDRIYCATQILDILEEPTKVKGPGSNIL